MFERLRAWGLSTISVNTQSAKGHVGEQFPWLALFPVFLTGLFYCLPSIFQEIRLVQFLPQLAAYLALVFWLRFNSGWYDRLGINLNGMVAGIKWGTVTGLLLGVMNTFVILWVVPSLGGDILFLKETPHAQMSTWVMVPWGILIIAIGVELNFRGFLLGRLKTLYSQWFADGSEKMKNHGSIFAVVGSALVFTFDPFMSKTFQHLHWVAVWDGLVWGWIFVRMKNLMVVIMAHTVEVVILYFCLRTALL